MRSKDGKNERHGMGNSRLYRTWSHMKGRCNNPNDQRYSRYGARGITYCAEWEKFSAFQEWAISNGYKDDLTIERINVHGNYEPANCTWIPLSDQSFSQERCNRVSIDGVEKSIGEWARISGLKLHTIYMRLTKYGKTGRDLIAPIKQRG